MASLLSEKLQSLVKQLRGQSRLTEANMAAMLDEIRTSLLEADVAIEVVQTFLARTQEKVAGQKVLDSLTPGQALVGIVKQELIQALGGSTAPDFRLACQPPAVILMVGLQGVGKTTSTVKLAKFLITKRKKKVLTVSVDVYRPAAILQLEQGSKKAGASHFASSAEQKPADIITAALAHAKRHFFDVLLIDTAGRTGIDAAMLDEVAAISKLANPIETLFVIDAMQGQSALASAQAFQQTLPMTGIFVTKTDGDARGGAMLSVRQITGAPIKFIGVSEKEDGLELFDADRFAGRIMGMGDVVALVEQAGSDANRRAAEKLASKLKGGGNFDLTDYIKQIEQMSQMGGIQSIIDKLPSQIGEKLARSGGQEKFSRMEKEFKRKIGMVHSMTPLERVNPEILKATRKKRIADGAGVEVQEVNRMLKEFDGMRDMMKKMGSGGMTKMMRSLGSKIGGAGGMGGLPGQFQPRP